MPSALEQPGLRVSVLIPTYNRAEYLRQALESVFAQSLAPWEVIVVDDGSTDHTAAVAGSFGPKVRYVRHESNRGISASRNSGLEAAQGEVIAWLDSDDLWEPAFLATVIPLFEADSSLDGVYTGLMRIDAAGNVLPQVSVRVDPAPELYSSLVQECFIQTSTFAARKKCYAEVGGFDPEFDICEDYDMFLRLARVCTIAGVPEPLVRYRVHAKNTVSDANAHCRFRLALTRKQFGSPEGDPLTWSEEKRRAHGYAFRAVALKCIQSGQADLGWDHLEKAVSIWPSLLDQLDTFYELACGEQPMGYRGQADLLDIERNGADMIHRLDGLVEAVPALESVRRPAYANTYLALAMLSDQAGDWEAARRYLFRAIRTDLRLAASPPVLRRLLKLCAGQRLVQIARTVTGSRGHGGTKLAA